MCLPQLDPDVRRALDIGHGRRRLAVAVDGAQERIIRRPDDAQQCPRMAVVIAEPAEALPVVAEPQDFKDDARQLVGLRQFKQDRQLFRFLRRPRVRLQRHQFQPRRKFGGDVGPHRTTDEDIEPTKFALDVAGQRTLPLDPELLLPVEAGDDGRLHDRGGHDAAGQGKSERIQVGKLQNHKAFSHG